MGNILKKMEKNLDARKANLPNPSQVRTKFHVPGSLKKKGK